MSTPTSLERRVLALEAAIGDDLESLSDVELQRRKGALLMRLVGDHPVPAAMIDFLARMAAGSSAAADLRRWDAMHEPVMAHLRRRLADERTAEPDGAALTRWFEEACARVDHAAT